MPDPLVDELAALICDQDQGCHDCVSGAGRVLKHLTNTGRLLPGSAATEHGWSRTDGGPVVMRDEAEAWAMLRAHCGASRIYRRQVGPWVAVDQAAGGG